MVWKRWFPLNIAIFGIYVKFLGVSPWKWIVGRWFISFELVSFLDFRAFFRGVFVFIFCWITFYTNHGTRTVDICCISFECQLLGWNRATKTKQEGLFWFREHRYPFAIIIYIFISLVYFFLSLMLYLFIFFVWNRHWNGKTSCFLISMD